ncbi:hypothetical protein LPUS_01858 [Lasallia pustulata]|uniref:Uncharacterized protein n=1 Tax=Lasallia pustulata TaxID=136370 RepID=A0A1W5CRK5_9LECA|nr:hypothetical protein LPUS_01858 [Lasallia pustulata]
MSLSMMSSSQPPAKRPKLSVQTSMLPLSLGHKSTTALTLSIATDTPTVSNTYANAFDVPPIHEPKEPARLTRHERPISPPSSTSSTSSTTTSSSRYTSPFPASIPYTVPMTARSILRNSPLPRRHLSATSARTPKIMFPPVKRVMFHDRLEELIPTPIVDELSDNDTSEDNEDPLVAQREDRGDASEGDDVPSTPVQGRRKRRREWVWTLGPIEVKAPPPPPDGDEDAHEGEAPDPGAVATDDGILALDGPGEEGHDGEGAAQNTEDVLSVGPGEEARDGEAAARKTAHVAALGSGLAPASGAVDA